MLVDVNGNRVKIGDGAKYLLLVNLDVCYYWFSLVIFNKIFLKNYAQVVCAFTSACAH